MNCGSKAATIPSTLCNVILCLCQSFEMIVVLVRRRTTDRWVTMSIGVLPVFFFKSMALLSPLKCLYFFRLCINSRDFRMAASNLDAVSMICVFHCFFLTIRNVFTVIYSHLHTYIIRARNQQIQLANSTGITMVREEKWCVRTSHTRSRIKPQQYLAFVNTRFRSVWFLFVWRYFLLLYISFISISIGLAVFLFIELTWADCIIANSLIHIFRLGFWFFISFLLFVIITPFYID